jgi:outer membrane protein
MSRLLTAVIAGLAGLAAAAAQAQDTGRLGQGDLLLNLRFTDIAPTGSDRTLSGAATGLHAKASYDVMPTVGLTYFLTDHVAVEAIAGTTKHTVRAAGPATAVKVKETWVLPPVVSLQYHFAPKAPVNPYVGAGVNYMLFYGGDDKNGFHFKVKDGFGAALQLGADVAAHDRWTVNIDVKKVFFDTTATDRVAGLRTKISLDPWVVSGGFGYRF